MSFADVCRATGQFISDFVRIILFLASLVALVLSGLLLYAVVAVSKSVQDAAVTDLNKSLLVLKVLAIYLVVLALVGMVSSFFASDTYMKWFLGLCSLNVLLIGIVLVSAGIDTDKNNALEIKQLGQQLAQMRAQYDWTGESKDSTKRGATALWDGIQITMQCCGYDKPDDWDHGSELPKSCCKDLETAKQVGVCKKAPDSYWQTGCRENIVNAIGGFVVLMVLILLFNAALAIMSCLVLACKPEERTAGYSY